MPSLNARQTPDPGSAQTRPLTDANLTAQNTEPTASNKETSAWLKEQIKRQLGPDQLKRDVEALHRAKAEGREAAFKPGVHIQRLATGGVKLVAGKKAEGKCHPQS